MHTRFRFILKVLIVIFLLTQATLAQVTTSRVDGTVTDASGGVIPGVKVALINTETEFTIQKTTNDSGLYVFPQVAPGNYRILAEMEGFKIATVNSVKVDVNVPRTVDIELEVGDISNLITVVADPAGLMMNTVNAEANTVIGREQIEALPLRGRNPTEFALMQAGVTGRGENTRTASVNGMRGSYNNMTLDGINNQDNFDRSDGFFGQIPVRDSFIEEFKLTSSNSGVDAGIGAVQTTMITRSGTNEYHGEVYYFHQNSGLNANNFFNNAARVPRPRVLNHQYGFNVGGPVVKNKLFFFFNYEEERDRNAISVVRTVFTEQARNGAFTYLRSDNGEPETVNLLTLGDAAADPVIMELIGATPTPTDISIGDGANTGGFRYNSPANLNSKWLNIRMDYSPFANHSISGVLHHYRNNLPNDPYTGSDARFPGLAGAGQKSSRYLATVSWNAVLGPTLVNEVRFGFQHASVDFFNNENFESGYRLNFPLVTNPVQNLMAQGRTAPVYTLSDNLDWVKGNHTFKIGGSVNWKSLDLYNDEGIVPEYSFGFSTANPNPLNTSMFPGGISGTNFSRASSQLVLLGGFVNSGSQTFNVKSRTSGFVDGYTESRIYSQRFFNLYAGDTWRLRSDLTVNYGLRWEYHGIPNETRGLALLPENGSADVLNPDAVLNFAGRGTGRDFHNGDYNNFAPSVGLAWRPFEKRSTVVRSGYSINYVTDNDFKTADNAVSANFGLRQPVSIYGISGTVSGGGIVPIETPEFMVPRTLRDNILLDLNSPVFTVDNNLRTPYVQQWLLSVQHEIFKDTVLEVRYVGNHGVKLIRAVDLNQAMLPEEFVEDFNRAGRNLVSNGDPYVGEELTIMPELSWYWGGLYYVPDLLLTNQIGDYIGSFLYNNRSVFFDGEGGENYGSTIPLSYFYQNPNARAADIVGNYSFSTYHALQMDLRRRFSNGLGFQANYTFGKALTDFGGDQNNFNAFMDNARRSIEKMRPDFDITHTFNVNFVHDLPFGSNRHFLIPNKTLNAVGGGWNISGILRLHSGEVVNIVSQRSTFNRSSRSGRNTVHLLGMSVQELQDKTGVYRDSNGRILMFDPSLISPDGTASDTYFLNPGAAEVGTLALSPVSGPWYFSTDLRLGKRVDLPLREGSAMEITASFANMFNRTNFDITATPGSLSENYSGIYNAQVINSSSFGVIRNAFSPRTTQVGIKIIF